jgi:hypothetical protein
MALKDRSGRSDFAPKLFSRLLALQISVQTFSYFCSYPPIFSLNINKKEEESAGQRDIGKENRGRRWVGVTFEKVGEVAKKVGDVGRT